MNTARTNSENGPANAPSLYAPPSTGAPIDLWLDANEGPGERGTDVSRFLSTLGPDVIRRYPNPGGLERTLAVRWNIEASQVLVTAGGDEAIDRACRVFLGPGRELILPTPTFEMIPRYARLAGAAVVTTSWPEGSYPIDDVLRLINERTAMIAVVSPNNPTGDVATASDLQRLAAAAPNAIVLVDLAYAEFAEQDLTAAALALPNAVVIRTFSKAFAMAGLRVGYAIGSAGNIRAMRAAGSPFPVCGLSLAAAEQAAQCAETYLPPIVARVRVERDRLFDLLTDLGARPRRSQGNFVLAEFTDAEWAWHALAGLGIAVRRFPPGAGLEESLRITCPGEERAFDRLCRGLRSALRPQALLFDMDGVLADVSGSYRRAIVLTAESFGVALTPGEISAAKSEGNANNDWVLTRRLLARRDVSASLAEVTDRFESLYHGRHGAPALAATERLIPPRELLERLAARLPLAIVTGRPRADCDCFLDRFELRGLFGAVVCMEDAAIKPDPAPVRLAMAQLGVAAAWMIGDTPDDVASARAAGVVPLGIAPPGEAEGVERDLLCAGAARVMVSLHDLESMLP